MILRATAPCRVDLAGGTLDIYPLYLFLDGGVTVNMAVDLYSRVEIQTRADAEVHLWSEDTGATLAAPDVASLPVGGDLDLVARVVKFYAPRTGVSVTTHSAAPHGSGLGASSSLLMALTGALDRLNGSGLTREQYVDLGANLEAQSIGIPTGKQDYCAALWGGVNVIWFGVEGFRVEPAICDCDLLERMERSIILSFTGETRFSGASNWNMLKAYIEDAGRNRDHMGGIKRTALRMREAVLSGDLERFAQIVHEEWENRRHLAEGVSTPRIERLMAATHEAGALASKICGAGGGGCMITVAEESARPAVIEALEANGARHLPYHIAREGLKVEMA